MKIRSKSRRLKMTKIDLWIIGDRISWKLIYFKFGTLERGFSQILYTLMSPFALHAISCLVTTVHRPNEMKTAVSVNSMTLFWWWGEMCVMFRIHKSHVYISFATVIRVFGLQRNLICARKIRAHAPIDFVLESLSFHWQSVWRDERVYSVCVSMRLKDCVRLSMCVCVCVWVNWKLRSQSHSIVLFWLLLLLLLLYIFCLSWLQTSERTREERERPFRVSQIHTCMERRIESREYPIHVFSEKKKDGKSSKNERVSERENKRVKTHTQTHDKILMWKYGKFEKRKSFRT